jgi:hypothetical protein
MLWRPHAFVVRRSPQLRCERDTLKQSPASPKSPLRRSGLKVAKLSQSHPAGVGLDDRPCWLLSYRGRYRYLSSFAATTPITRAPSTPWIWRACYTRATPIQRRYHVSSGWEVRFEFKKLVGGEGFEPSASRSRTGRRATWSPRPDSNRGPFPYQGNALPPELRGRAVGQRF